MITMTDALNATMFYHATVTNADRKTSARARRNGRTQTWKTRPGEFRVPACHGLKGYLQITHHNAHDWHTFDRADYERQAGLSHGAPLEMLADRLIDVGLKGAALDVMAELNAIAAASGRLQVMA
jgi:hypothetical protein